MTLTGPVVPVESAEESLGREHAHRRDVLDDKGDRRFEQVCQQDLVKPDQYDAFMQACLAQAPDGTDGDEVLTREHRCRRRASR